jgi:hypothetical protein
MGCARLEVDETGTYVLMSRDSAVTARIADAIRGQLQALVRRPPSARTKRERGGGTIPLHCVYCMDSLLWLAVPM